MIVGDSVQRAKALIEFADGVEQAGWIDYARRARAVAGDVVDLVEQLAAERSARVAQQARADRLEQLLLHGRRFATVDDIALEEAA